MTPGRRVFGIGGCDEVTSFIFWAQEREKRERQKKGCVAVLSFMHTRVGYNFRTAYRINFIITRRVEIKTREQKANYCQKQTPTFNQLFNIPKFLLCSEIHYLSRNSLDRLTRTKWRRQLQTHTHTHTDKIIKHVRRDLPAILLSCSRAP